MKTLIVVLLLAAGGGYGWYAYNQAHPERRACAHMAELCGDTDKEGKRADCERSLAKLGELDSSKEGLRQSAQCISEATSCPAAVGCMVGSLGKAGAGALEQFLRGVGKSLGN